MYKNDIEKERNNSIFKKVKHHVNELKKLRPDYRILMVCCQGSQNYNLDLYTDEYKSDIDTVAMVLPSFDNFVNNDKLISETIVLDNNEHIDVKNIRLLFELFKKQNIKYLEVLFSPYKIVDKYYRKTLDRLFLEKENIAHYNIDKLIRTTFGMQQEKYKAMEHPYEGLKDKIEKYGYDPKQLHHIIRLTYFLFSYCSYDRFEEALDANTYEPYKKRLLTDSKIGKYSLEEARGLAKDYLKQLSDIRALYEGKLKYNLTIDIDKFLDEIQIEIFNEYFRDMFTPKEIKIEKRKANTSPTLKRIFVTSDVHFGHENILTFEPKRWDMIGINKQEAISKYIIENNIEVPNTTDKCFKEKWEKIEKEVNHLYIEQHDEELIRRWNSKVSDKDTVYILGDLSFYSGPKTNEILKRLKGKKILIKGNHDMIYLNDKRFDKLLFEEIVDYKEVRSEGYIFIMFHFPIAVWNLSHKGAIHLFGHIHSNETTVHPLREFQEREFNVGVDVNDYYPSCILKFVA